MPKPVEFRGSSLDDLRTFPLAARREAGRQLDQIQNGQDADDWKPMNTAGQGVKEIRIRDAAGAFPDYLRSQVCRRRIRPALLPEKDGENQQRQPGSGRKALPGFIEGARTMSNQRFDSVWDAIEDTPEEAENMKLRSILMSALKSHLTHTQMSQAEAAKLFGVTQPRVSDLMRGKINLFGLDALVNMATATGLHIEMRVLEAA
jgi:predicted XRE-type DNA-binding protein